jgi:hypothetical protein
MKEFEDLGWLEGSHQPGTMQQKDIVSPLYVWVLHLQIQPTTDWKYSKQIPCHSLNNTVENHLCGTYIVLGIIHNLSTT